MCILHAFIKLGNQKAYSSSQLLETKNASFLQKWARDSRAFWYRHVLKLNGLRLEVVHEMPHQAFINSAEREQISKQFIYVVKQEINRLIIWSQLYESRTTLKFYK